MADANRALQSHRLLNSLLSESVKAEERLVVCTQKSVTLMTDITAIETRMMTLQQELNAKLKMVEIAENEIEEVALKLQINQQKKAGLCIR
jgi:hypothetical protein